MPYTLIIMLGTNNELFRLLGLVDDGVIGLGEVEVVVRRWAWMHFFRALLPLIGAVVGGFGLVRGGGGEEKVKGIY